MHWGNPDSLLLSMPLMAVLIVFACFMYVNRRRQLSRFASHSAMLARLPRSVNRSVQRTKMVLFVVGMALLSVALVEPQFGTVLEMAKRKGVDGVVALDVSRSMLAEDVRPNRLERARFQIGELVERLEGDRVGLVLFAGGAFIQCPLTVDYGAFRLLLSVVGAGSIPVQGTAIGDAIRLALKCFDEGDRQHKVIVLLTDGEDHETDPMGAAEMAIDQGARVLVVGMGTPEGELIPLRGDDGQVDYHQDKQGNYVKTRLDEASSREVALATDGAYFRSSLKGAETELIYDLIANMDQKEFGSERFAQHEQRYQYPLFAAIVCLLLAAMLPEGNRKEEEWRGRFA